MKPTKSTRTRLTKGQRQPEGTGQFEKALEKIQELGGTLHFTIEKTEEGWSAQCDEMPGILTGGLNHNPDNFEIESQIREAIHTAFHLIIKVSPEKLKSSIFGLSLSVV